MGVFPTHSYKVKVTRSSEGNHVGVWGVDASADFVLLNSHSAEKGAACVSPVVGALNQPLGISTKHEIVSRPSCLARNANGIMVCDSVNVKEYQKGRQHAPEITKIKPTELACPKQSRPSRHRFTFNPSQ